MSLLSNILKIGGAGLAAGAAPFTGGVSTALLPAILAGGGAAASGLGSVLSGAAAGSADQRGSENTQAAQRNALLAQIYGTQQGAALNAANAGANEKMNQRGQALDEKKFALAAPSVRANQSVRGSILQNAQPLKLSGLPDRVASHIPTIEGGLSPAMFSDDTRALGGEMSRQALINQLKGDTFDPMESTDFSKSLLPTPKLEEFQKSGLLEKILGGLGMGSAISGAIGNGIKSRGDIPVQMVGNNTMPVPYGGEDMYRNPSNYRLPRPELMGGA